MCVRERGGDDERENSVRVRQRRSGGADVKQMKSTAPAPPPPTYQSALQPCRLKVCAQLVKVLRSTPLHSDPLVSTSSPAACPCNARGTRVANEAKWRLVGCGGSACGLRTPHLTLVSPKMIAQSWMPLIFTTLEPHFGPHRGSCKSQATPPHRPTELYALRRPRYSQHGHRGSAAVRRLACPPLSAWLPP